MISGKPRAQCIQALRAAFGNPDRAFEFLMSGIPPAGSQPGGEEGGEEDYGDEEGAGVGAGGNPFAALA